MSGSPITSFSPQDAITVKEDGKDVLYIVMDPAKFLVINVKKAVEDLDLTPTAISADKLGEKVPPPNDKTAIFDWLVKEIEKKKGK